MQRLYDTTVKVTLGALEIEVDSLAVEERRVADWHVQDCVTEVAEFKSFATSRRRSSGELECS